MKGYGVAATHVYRGKVLRTALVAEPHGGNWSWVSIRDKGLAGELCESMRRADYGRLVTAATVAYTVVPLPTTE